MFKVNNRNTRTKVSNMFKVNCVLGFNMLLLTDSFQTHLTLVISPTFHFYIEIPKNVRKPLIF